MEAALDVLDAELLDNDGACAVAAAQRHGLELRLPDPSVITLIIRDGHTFVPQPDTRIAIGDELLIVTTVKTRGRRTEAPCRESTRQARLLVRRVRRSRLIHRRHSGTWD